MSAERLRWVAVGVILIAMAALFNHRRRREARQIEDERAAERTAAAMALASDAGAAPSPAAPAADAAGVVQRTVRDPALRDDVRRRIWTAWNQQGSTYGAPPPDPLHAPMPVLDGGAVDPQYIRTRIREDFVPMAQTCYESFLGRRPNVGGRVLMDFTILGDPHIGGVIDQATVGDANSDAGPEAAGVFDREFVTCLRESLMTVAFAPPPQSGSLHVRYPIALAPDAPDAAAPSDAPAR